MNLGIDIHAHGVPLQFLDEVKRTRLGGVEVAAYVKSLYYDTTIMSAPALQMLLDLVGAGQVMIGSDYAAGPVERPGPKLTAALDAVGLDAAGHRRVLRDTAESLFQARGKAGSQ
jgi:hypothetical protein